MTRKGDISLLGKTGIMLLTLVVLVVLFKMNVFTPLQNAGACAGTCIPNERMDTCGSATYVGCPKGQVCCSPKNDGSSSSGSGTIDSGIDDTASLAALPKATISVKYGKSTASSISLLNGITPEPIVATVSVPYYVPYSTGTSTKTTAQKTTSGTTTAKTDDSQVQAMDQDPARTNARISEDDQNDCGASGCKTTTTTTPKTISQTITDTCAQLEAAKTGQKTGEQYYDTSFVCKYPSAWTVTVTLETDTKKVIESKKFEYDNRGSLNPIANSGGVEPSIMKLDGGSTPNNPNYNHIKYIKQAIQPIKISFTDDVYKKYASQTIYLVITASANDGALSTQERIAIKPSYIVGVDMLEQWSNVKDVKAYCNKNSGIRCDKMALKIVSNSDDCKEIGTLSTTPINSVSKGFKIMDKDGKVLPTLYPTEGDCNNAIVTYATSSNALSSTVAMNIATKILEQKELSQQVGTNDENLLALSKAIDAAQYGETMACIDVSQLKSENVVNFDMAYPVDSFNVETQIGLSKLTSAQMGGKYLCAYGHETGAASDKWYSSGKPKKIMLDKSPPIASVKFSPVTTKITYTCVESKPDEESGCKPSFEYAYISDPVKFLSSLFAAPQSAKQWCPTTGYSTETRTVVPYTGNGVQVLCLRWYDNAGNPGQSIITVYDPYSLSAGLLAMQKQ